MQTLKYYLIIAVLVVLSGCSGTTARIQQFDQFAEAGKAYADAMALLTEESAKFTIDTDSFFLIDARDELSPEERTVKIEKNNTILKERIRLLGEIRRHAMLLESYFMSLSSLAQSDAPSGIGVATEGIVDSLRQINEDIQKTSNISKFTGKATNIFAAQFQRSALEKELKNRAAIIERELEFQQAVLQVITEQMQTDLVLLPNPDEEEIIAQYGSTSPLPEDWSKKRKEALTATDTLATVHAAIDAAKNLKISFVALAENRLQLANMSSLLKDINEILTLLEKNKVKEN